MKEPKKKKRMYKRTKEESKEQMNSKTTTKTREKTKIVYYKHKNSTSALPNNYYHVYSLYYHDIFMYYVLPCIIRINRALIHP